jgi:hypothetical protein
MKKPIPFILFAVLLFACSIPSFPTQPAVTEPSVVTEPPIVTEPAVVTETSVVTEPPIVTNVTCNELAIYLDPALASGYSCETVSENTEGMELNPPYTKLSLQGYMLSDKFFEPVLAVYPVQRFSEILPDFVPGFVSSLQSLTTGAPDPIYAGTFDSPHLPFLPVFNAGQVFFAGYQVVPFVSGGGIRYLTEFAQYLAPVNNNDLFYTYQGLTSDGQYWVSAILPINNPVLPASSDPLPGGMSFEDFSNNYGPYITNMVNQLNTLSPDSYTPSFAMLDTLAASITIQP